MIIGRILITGATGFIGTALVKRLLHDDVRFAATVLEGEDGRHLPAGVERISVPPLSDSCDYSAALRRIEIVVHLAARVHIMREMAADPLREFREVNLRGTDRLARQAAAANVKRFVFLSTIGVNGNMSGPRAFTESDEPCPHNYYSISKHEAEIRLGEIRETTGIETVIIRAPLVYGQGVKGNMLKLLNHLYRGLPLPISDIPNQRSFVSLENLVDILMLAATRGECAGQTFLVSDGEDISTADLVRMMAQALGKPGRTIAIPDALLKTAANLLPRFKPVLESLTGSLVIDSSKFKEMLKWSPPQTMHDGIDSMVSDFLRKRGHVRQTNI